MSVALRPRHRESPRARRLAAEAAETRTAAEASETRTAKEAIETGSAPGPSGTRAASSAFAVAEVDVDLSATGDDVVPYVANAVVDALPAGPVHLAVWPGPPSPILDAGDLSLSGLRRRLSERDPAPASESMPADGSTSAADDATFTLVVSSLTSEMVPPTPGQFGTLVLGASVERPAVVRLSDGSAGIAVRSFARLTFAYDHRELGRTGAVRFLTAVKRRLETETP
jgi:hypothetical protein